MPSGLTVHGQNDDVVQNAQRLGIVAAHHLPDEFHQLLRAQNFRGMQTAIDPNHRLAFMRQRARFVVGEPFGERQLARDFLVMLQLLVIFGRGDDGHPLRAALFGLADLDQLHAIGLGGQFLPPGGELCVIGELVIVADLESEGLLRRREVARGLSRGRDYEEYRERRSRNPCPSYSLADRFHPCALILLMISVLLVDNSWSH